MSRTAWRNGTLVLLTAGLALGAPAPAAAQVVSASASGGRHGGTMQVPLHKSQVLRIDRPFAQVLVGNSEIADVLPMNAGSVYVMGKKAGATNLTLYDKRRNLVAVVDLVVGPDAEALKAQLFEMMPGEAVQVRAANESVVLSGQVSSAAAAMRIAQVAETYAPKNVVNMLSLGSPQQVLLEVRFSEMRRGTLKQLGISTFGVSNSLSNLGQPKFDGSTGDGTQPETFGRFTGSFGIGGLNISLQLDALEQRGLVTTLAEPNLVAMSGETASFLAGGEFPIPVASNADGQGTTVSIEFKEFGVSLAFTPTVLEDGIINLSLLTEVSSIDPAASITLNNITIPGLSTRRAKTVMELRDGQAFAMAGLIRKDFTDTVRQIPLLGQIPIIGALFRSSEFQRDETELVIVVTPRIVRPTTIDRIAMPLDRVGEPSDAEMFLLGKTEKRLPGAPVPGGIDGRAGHIVR